LGPNPLGALCVDTPAVASSALGLVICPGYPLRGG
jgi:hypothetical protein